MRYLIVALLALGALNCEHSAPTDATQIVGDSTALATAPVGAVEYHRDLSAREEQLVERLEQLYPGKRGAELRKAFSDTRVFAVTMPAHPEARSILAELASIRTQPTAAPVADSNIIDATLAMPSTWSDSTVSAIVVRRPSVTPSDVILLPPNAGPANLAAGVRALSDLRKAESGGVARDARVVVHGANVPALWKTKGLDAAAIGKLRELAGAQFSAIHGIGNVRTAHIPVRLRHR